MLHIIIHKNLVLVDKTQPEVPEFLRLWLTKVENVTSVDSYQSTGTKKKLCTIKIPRKLYTETDQFIVFARGILEWIPKGVYVIDEQDPDSITMPTPTLEEIKHTLPTFDLRDDQIIAVNKCLRCKRGVIQLPTAVGKSAIIASTISWLLKFNPDMKILAIAPTISTVEGLHNTFIKNNLPSSIFDTNSSDLSTPITASLVQTLCTSDFNDTLQQVQVVFYDECLPKSAKILLPGGHYKTIEQIYEDDSINEVISYNLETNTYEIKPIIRKIRQDFNDRFCRVYYFDPVNKKFTGLTCTVNHKVYTKNRGYVPAGELLPTDQLKIDYPNLRYTSFASEIYLPVSGVSLNRGRIAKVKYNLEVADNHNYFADNVLVSNCHHLKCDTWNQLNNLLPNVEYSLGFSALAIDKKDVYKSNFWDIDYDTALIAGNSGRVLLHMDASYYIQKGIIALPVVFRLTNTIQFPAGMDESNWADVVKYGLRSPERTQLIIDTASFFMNQDRKALVLIFEKEYALELAQALTEQNPDKKIGVSFGAGKGFIYSFHDGEVIKEKRESLEVINDLSEGNVDLLIGTSHIDEGVDISKLDVLILANGGKKNRRVIQRLGRVLRKSKTGRYAYIVDFMDQQSRVLTRQSELRLEMYENEIGILPEHIYNTSLLKLKERFFELEGIERSVSEE